MFSSNMNNVNIRANHFYANVTQSLRQVTFYSPTIVWVSQGQNRLQYLDKITYYDRDDWLLIPAGQILTFSNQPEKGNFHSRVLSLLNAPSQEILNDCQNTKNNDDIFRATPNESLKSYFEFMFCQEYTQLSQLAQQHLLNGFYAEINHQGLLGKLFIKPNEGLSVRVAKYLASNPEYNHNIDNTAQSFHMSRATMNRRLTAEGTSFRQILTNIRMSHAIELMQEKRNHVDIAKSCGYLSETRFRDRFTKTFGLSPREYVATL